MTYICCHKPFILIFSLIMFSALHAGCTNSQPSGTDIMPDITHIDPDAETGTSLAAVVEDVPLAFTTQIFPVDENGRITGEGDAGRQAEKVISNLSSALAAAGTGLEALVRLNVYLTDDSFAETVLSRLADLLPEHSRPAVTLVSGSPTRSHLLVSMDAVAVAPDDQTDTRVTLFQSDDLSGLFSHNHASRRSHAAVLAPGRKLFISGQAEMADNLQEATQLTMQSLFATLAYAGASSSDIVHIKAFINPVNDAEETEKVIAGFFRDQQTPPIVTLEWLHESFPAEIEIVASAPSTPRNEEAASYYAPVWMSQATTFSRLVDVQKGNGLVFTSGLYGTDGQDGNEQAAAIFETLSRLLEEAGSDYDHLVKGTYYPSSEEGRQGLLNVRTEYYNPDRPPAASLAEIGGAGRPGRTLNVDMIGVITGTE